MSRTRNQPPQTVAEYHAERDKVRAMLDEFRVHHPYRRFLEVPAELTTDEARRLLETAAMEKRLQ